ncbi:cytochrome P450 [Auriscalpium vulgare]|uniref:Cytochrome P450 n=1 Tax=Auriscalpium vulgare TaxID=40419 RepID=A0ACB8R628_9AGAM|nr:cytochrome P450 [Auriscalpium vulgare]
MDTLPHVSWLTLCAPILAYAAYQSALLVISYVWSPLRYIPGPPRKYWLTGSFEKGVWEPDAIELQEKWVQKYGHVFKYGAFWNMTNITVTDLKAINHIFTHGNEFPKPMGLRHLLGDLLGTGLLFVEGSQHRQQRKIMNPAFGLPQIRKFTDLFIDKSIEFRDALLSDIHHSDAVRPDGKLRIDAYFWLNKVTLDIIGLAGFNYAFNAIPQDKPNALVEGFRASMEIDPFSLSTLLPIVFPPSRYFPMERNRQMARTLKVINTIGTKLIAEKKAEILAITETDAKGGVEKRNIQGHDLLSLLMKANMASDIPDNQRMSDADILSQVPTFLIAGHETTSTSLAWTLFALSAHPAVRARLNAELRAHPSDTPSMDELAALPYLDKVAREVLRLYCPVNNTERAPLADTTVPLEKPFIGTDGLPRHEFPVPKGQSVLIPIRLLNRSKELWGADAHEFNPDRWDSIPDKVQEIPSIFSHLLTFIAGAHACIGYRFSIIEMKAILFTFVRAFDFELAVSPEEIIRKTMIVARPVVESESDFGHQLPILIWPAKVE